MVYQNHGIPNGIPAAHPKHDGPSVHNKNLRDFVLRSTVLYIRLYRERQAVHFCSFDEHSVKIRTVIRRESEGDSLSSVSFEDYSGSNLRSCNFQD